jgi:gamma-glutamylcysteine synthetase
MGINPYRKYNKEIPIPNERYLMLYHYLKSYDNYRNQPIYFHNYPGFGMFSSSSQVQLDVHYDDLIKTINTFSHLEPIKGLLFSNSVFLDENKGVTCFRDALWEYSTHGVNQHNIGAYDIDFESMSELENYLQTLNIYCVERNGSYIDFPTMNLLDYFKEDKISGEKYTPEGYEKIDVIPQLDDIKYLRAFKFINLTFRGTLEYRSVCTQPIKDSMSVAAFHVGLNNRIDELDDILKNDHSLTYKGYNYDELRKLLIQDELPSFIDRDALCSLTKQILDLSRDGLEERGIGEEKFIDCLYDRVKNRTNPGKELIKSLKNNVPIEDMIRKYGELY